MEKTELLRLDAYVVSDVKEDSGEGFLEFSSVSGNWVMRLRDDVPVNLLLRGLISQGDVKEYLEAFVMLNYTASIATPDWVFVEDFLNAYHACVSRWAEKMPKEELSEEEEEKLAAQMRAALEIVETLEEENGVEE